MERVELIETLRWLGIGDEDAGVLLALPLIRVVWADGGSDPREGEVVRSFLAARGLTSDEQRRIVEGWLTLQPSAEYTSRGTAALIGLAKHRFGLGRSVNAEGLAAVIPACDEVAKASGGVLGLFAVSAAERAVLDEVRQSLAPEVVAVDSLTDPWAPPPKRVVEPEDDDDDDEDDDDEGEGVVRIGTGLRLGVKKVKASEIKEK